MSEMKPPGRVTLTAMRDAAAAEATRIEDTQAALVKGGDLREPMPQAVRSRDAFAGIVRLIDKIMFDDVLSSRLKQ